ncbi:MAG: lipopolysaccharide biosynthesis protein, partial [Gammaproteobacteria bacterium]|nr:lipopolysaccharide biosynthesis protein [Gammaproteobacteria bacterium]
MAFEIAVPEDDNRSFSDYLDALKRRRKPALILALSLLVAGGLGIFLWPNSYTSTAVILIEDPEIPPGLVPSTVTTFASRQIQYINQRVMTRTNLASIIEKFDLFPEERKYLPTLLLVPDVEKDMKIDVIDVQQPSATGQQVTST